MTDITRAESEKYKNLMDIMLNPKATENDAKLLASQAKSGAEIAKKIIECHVGNLSGNQSDLEGIVVHLSVALQLSMIAGTYDFVQHVQIQDFEKQFGEAS